MKSKSNLQVQGRQESKPEKSVQTMLSNPKGLRQNKKYRGHNEKGRNKAH